MTKDELDEKLRSSTPNEQMAFALGLLAGVVVASLLAPRVNEAVRRVRRRREARRAHQAPYLRLLPAADSVKTPDESAVSE